jgi:hypothetical protein
MNNADHTVDATVKQSNSAVTERAEVACGRPRQLTEAELAGAAGIGGVGIYGFGRLRGEIEVGGRSVALLTAAKGTRNQVSFTLDLPERQAHPLEGKTVWVDGLIHKISPCQGTIAGAVVVRRPKEHLMPGDHVLLSGRIENRHRMGLGGEAPPSGSYLVLEHPIHVGRASVQEVYLQHPEFAVGEKVKVYGRIEVLHFGGVETQQRTYVALSGVSNLTAGEPSFNGVQFHSALNGAHLRVLVVKRRDIFDAPNVIVVLDPAERRAFLGTMGGFLVAGTNPFHGFTTSAEFASPTDADRAAVRFDAEGHAISVATGEPLLEVGHEAPPPGTADMFSYTWYFDDANETVYTFVTGGIAGFINRMESVVQFVDQPDVPTA